tara:strand:+ start:8456 stop:8629 length:174 start_codon:yes stop_codon:yes gene_type:complete
MEKRFQFIFLGIVTLLVVAQDRLGTDIENFIQSIDVIYYCPLCSSSFIEKKGKKISP